MKKKIEIENAMNYIKPLLKSWAMISGKKEIVISTIELKLKEVYNEGFKEGFKEGKTGLDPNDLRPDQSIPPSILNGYHRGYKTYPIK